ncbi:hypothetical protein TWF132_001858 [Orbilia oligospora]|nr:hypothetical protein TWF132_001858 [Orbilia oligospora]
MWAPLTAHRDRSGSIGFSISISTDIAASETEISLGSTGMFRPMYNVGFLERNMLAPAPSLAQIGTIPRLFPELESMASSILDVKRHTDRLVAEFKVGKELELRARTRRNSKLREHDDT